jgi:hypothetical protein
MNSHAILVNATLLFYVRREIVQLLSRILLSARFAELTSCRFDLHLRLLQKWRLKMPRNEELATHAPKRKQSAHAQNLEQASAIGVRDWTRSVYMETL